MNAKCQSHLRSLAGKYAEYALGDVMTHRREKWRLHNRLQEKTFPFHIEDNGIYLRDVSPPLQCEDETCRHLEAQLLRVLVSYEKINDDNFIEYLKKYRIDYIVWDKKLYPEWGIDRFNLPEAAVFEDAEVWVYEVVDAALQ